MKNNILITLIMFCCCLLYTSSTIGQDKALQIKQQNENCDIPEQSQALFQEINESLKQSVQLFPFTKGNAIPVVAPELYLAGSGFGISVSSQKWKDIIATLDAFKNMNVDAVSVMIAAPDLTFGDSSSLISFYQRLVNEIHLRKMKLYVEHFDNPPFSPHAYKNLRNTPQGKKEFLDMREKELTIIYRTIKPDFLSIITEPETMMRWTHLSFSAEELADWVGQVSTHLKSLGVSSNTLLGAGAGTWEPENFVIKLAQQKILDYIDIHVYALNSSVKETILHLDSLIHNVRKIEPAKKITIGETWLYKHGIKEPVTFTMYKETFYRDNFSFWSPLDQEFMGLIMGIAQKDDISVVVPYFSQYFFTYFTFGDKDSENLPPWPGSVLTSWNEAIKSIHNHHLTSTGKAMSLMLNGIKK